MTGPPTRSNTDPSAASFLSVYFLRCVPTDILATSIRHFELTGIESEIAGDGV